MARSTVFVNRMPANDDDTVVSYGDGKKVLHQVKRTAEQDENGYPDQLAIEVGEPDPEPDNA